MAVTNAFESVALWMLVVDARAAVLTCLVGAMGSTTTTTLSVHFRAAVPAKLSRRDKRVESGAEKDKSRVIENHEMFKLVCSRD